MTVKRLLRASVLAAIAATAGLGLYAVAVPDFGELQAKVLATSACVTGAGVVVLACLPAWERRRLLPAPVLGAAAGAAAFSLLVAGMWAEIEARPYTKTTATLFVAAAAGTLASLLALARLAPRHRWTLAVALALVLVLALLGVAGIWAEPPAGEYGRAVGAAGVVTAAFVLAVPVLHRAGRRELPTGGERPSLRFCPSCGRPLGAPAGGDSSCPACGASFRVRFRPAGSGQK